MKKNLFGAVAVGLALALAFTACESGNDDPVKLAYTRANYGYDPAAAAENEDVFTYSAAPTNIFYNTEIATGASGNVGALAGDVDVGYDLTSDGAESCVKGVQSFNKRTGKWNVKATPEAGLVYNTIIEWLTFNPADGTFVRDSLLTESEIKEIVFLTATERAALDAPGSYDVIARADLTQSIDEYIEADPTDKLAWSYREGARYAIYATVTGFDEESGAIETTGTVSYVSSLKSDAVVYHSEDLSALVTGTALHPELPATGTFSISGNFANGKILLTSWVEGDGSVFDYVFDDDAGTYVNNAESLNNPVKGDIARDFPETSRSVLVPGANNTASEFCKTGRTLKIKNKVLTANKIQTNLTGIYHYNGLLSYQNPEFSANAALYDELAESFKYGLID